MSLKIGDTIELIHYCPDPENPGNTFDGLAAEVLESYRDGSVHAEMLYSSPAYGIPQYVTLQKGTFRPAVLYPFDVTVTRTGLVGGILAINEANAMATVDRSITHEDVSWNDDWPATDAQRQS